MRKLITVFLGLVLLVGVIVTVGIRVPGIQDRLFSRVIQARLGAGPAVTGSDTMLQVVLCGTGGPFADADRAGPCTFVLAGEQAFLVDSGTGGAQNLQRLNVPLGKLDGIFYTHLHSDHIAGLGDIALNSWAAGRRSALRLYGPPGVEDLAAGFESAFQIDSRSRIDHHGAEIFEPAARSMTGITLSLPPETPHQVVYQKDGLTVTAFRVTHIPLENAYGYRFDYKGRALVISGDTVKDSNIARMSKNADVLLHEAAGQDLMQVMADELEKSGSPDVAKILRDAAAVHTTPVEAAEIANEAGVPLLVLHHIVPPQPAGFIEDIFMRGVADIRKEGVIVGRDGLLIQLPAESGTIEYRDLR